MTPPRDDDFLMSQADMFVEQASDMETKMGQFYYGDDEKKKVIKTNLVKVILHNYQYLILVWLGTNDKL